MRAATFAPVLAMAWGAGCAGGLGYTAYTGAMTDCLATCRGVDGAVEGVLRSAGYQKNGIPARRLTKSIPKWRGGAPGYAMVRSRRGGDSTDVLVVVFERQNPVWGNNGYSDGYWLVRASVTPYTFLTADSGHPKQVAPSELVRKDATDVARRIRDIYRHPIAAGTDP
jgi:hypothetical protein